MRAKNIVLYSFDKDSDTLLINVLQKHYKNISIAQSISAISQYLKEGTPKVILISGEKFQDTLATYYHALDKVNEFEMCDHFFVSLVSKHDETEAYEAYRSGIIDDYLVSRPLYEVHRPTVICDHLLIELGVAKSEKEGLEYIYKQDKYDDKVRSIVAKGLERKEMMKSEFESSLSSIEEALDNASIKIQQNQKVKLDLEVLKSTLAEIKSNQIRPELIKLQDKALSLLHKVVTDTNGIVKSKNNDAEQTKAQQESSSTNNEITPQVENTFNNFQGKDIDVDAVLKKVSFIPKVLLIEDDPISIHLTSQLMESYKIELETAFSGRRALACIKNRHYDLIFLDLNLPDTNGLYILDQLKFFKPKDKNTIVIILSGNKNKATAMKAIEMGARGYIVKPMRKEKFIEIFKKFSLPLKKK